MFMTSWFTTFLTKIENLTSQTKVSVTFDWCYVATITSHSLMNNFWNCVPLQNVVRVKAFSRFASFWMFNWRFGKLFVTDFTIICLMLNCFHENWNNCTSINIWPTTEIQSITDIMAYNRISINHMSRSSFQFCTYFVTINNCFLALENTSMLA